MAANIEKTNSSDGIAGDPVYFMRPHTSDGLRFDPRGANRYPTDRPLRVLSVDDVEINNEVVALYLSMVGLQVESAITRAQVMEVLASGPIDLVFLDLQLEDETGQDIAKTIRAMNLPVQPVIVALSGFTAPECTHSVRDAGMDGYVTKPVSPDQLHAVVERFFGAFHAALEPESLSPSQCAFQIPKFVTDPTVAELYRSETPFMEHCLQLYGQSLKMLSDPLMRSINIQDRVEIGRTVHRLKGMAGNVGDGRMKALCEAIEQALNAGPDQQVFLAQGLSDVRGLLTTRAGELAPRAELTPVQSIVHTPIYAERVRNELVPRLLDRLRHHRPIDATEVSELYAYLSASCGADVSRQWLDATEQFEFKQAIQILEQNL